MCITDKDWEHRSLKSVVLGWWDYAKQFFFLSKFSLVLLSYWFIINKQQEGDYRNIQKMPEADVFWPEPRACRAQISASYSYSIGFIFAEVGTRSGTACAFLGNSYL